MNFLIFAWIASIAYGLEAVLAKLIGKHLLANPWLFNFAWNFFILLFTVPVALYFGAPWPKFWVNLLWSGFFYALTGVFFILALYRLDVSILAPFFSFRSIFSLGLGAFFLAERLTPEQLFLALAIIIFGVFVTFDERWTLKSFLNSSIALALLTMLSLSLMGYFIKISISENGYWSVTLFMPIISQLFLLLTAPKFVNGRSEAGLRNIGSVAALALIGLVGTLSANKAYSENIGLSSVIISLPFSMLLAFFISVIFPSLLERHSPKVYMARFFSAAVMIVAAIKLSLG